MLQPRRPTVTDAQDNGESKGKYDEKNAKGEVNGKGFGVDNDPKACADKNKKQCKKEEDACDWDEDEDVCIPTEAVSSNLKEQVGDSEEDPMKMQPNTAAVVPQAVTIMNLAAMVVGFVTAMWYGN